MSQGPEEKTALLETPWPDEPPVLGPGQSYGSMTDQIADAVLTRPIGFGWLGGLAIAMGCVATPDGGRHLSFPGRRWHLGH